MIPILYRIIVFTATGYYLNGIKDIISDYCFYSKWVRRNKNVTINTKYSIFFLNEIKFEYNQS